jgi:hypothetical protein
MKSDRGKFVQEMDRMIDHIRRFKVVNNYPNRLIVDWRKMKVMCSPRRIDAILCKEFFFEATKQGYEDCSFLTNHRYKASIKACSCSTLASDHAQVHQQYHKTKNSRTDVNSVLTAAEIRKFKKKFVNRKFKFGTVLSGICLGVEYQSYGGLSHLSKGY